MNHLTRSATLGVFIGTAITILLALVVKGQPLPPFSAPNFSEYVGVFNLLATPAAAISTAASASDLRRGSATLKWDASRDLSVVGYRLYWGTKSADYRQSINAGTNTTAKISGLDEGVMYYFAATAYDSIGVESPFSNEATTVTGFYIGLQIKVWEVSAFGALGKTNEMQTSTNLSDWWTFKTWIGNGAATNALHTNSAKSYFRVRVK